jgi:hypothetical protein
MNPDQLEALFRQQLAALPLPAGIPPASNNPKLHDAAQKLMLRIVEIMMRFGVVSPTIVPPPAPPGPMASMDASDLNLRADVYFDEVG